MMHPNTSLSDYLQNIDKVKINELGKGKYNSIISFFNEVVKPKLIPVEIISQWNNLLKEYVNNPNAIFFIRRYASAPKNDWTKIRRGFLTKCNGGLHYAYCDNYLAHYFYTMSLDHFVPVLDDFTNTIINRKFPYGVREDKEEIPFRAFPKGKAPRLNSAGWKLSHVYSVNKEDYSFDYKSEKALLFPIGEQVDWKMQKGYSYPIRLIPNPPISEFKEKIISHFIRFVHPLNYFLSPQKNHSTFDIGESTQLRNMVIEHFKIKYGSVYDDFLGLIMPSDFNSSNAQEPTFPYKFERGIGKKGTKVQVVVKKVPSKVSAGKLKKMIKAYLVDGKSFRAIEKDILKIEPKLNGGGFVAKCILNSNGITAKHKEILKGKRIETVYNKARGELKESIKILM